MDEKPNRGRRARQIVLGLLAIPASVLWMLFWLVALAWEWPPELGIAVFSGACFALGIVAFVGGLFLVAGRFPSRPGWLVVGAVALVPLALLAPLGVATSSRASEVDEVAARVLAQRAGASNVTAECVWENDRAGSELWRCDVTSTGGGDRCFVWFTERADGLLGARVDRCERDDVLIAHEVQRAYRERTGVATVTADFCSRIDRAAESSGGTESWRCGLDSAADGYCYARVTWGRAGNLNVAISHCEREVSTAVVDAYAKRSGTRADGAQCTEDEQNDGEWICDLGAAADHDRCFVTFGLPARTRVDARIVYCQDEVLAAVNSVVERMYEKRTSFDDVTVTCALEEHEQWGCEIRLPSGLDRCDVWIERRAAGPRAEMKLTTCESGRI